MTEVIPGIYQLQLPLPEKDILLGYVNVYLIEGDSGHLLIDTGPNTEEAFSSLNRQLDILFSTDSFKNFFLNF